MKKFHGFRAEKSPLFLWSDWSDFCQGAKNGSWNGAVGGGF